MSKNLVQKKSNIRNAGNGLFANKIFRKGDNVAEYFGVPVTKDHIYKLYNNDKNHYMKEIHPFIRDIDDTRVIVGGMDKNINKCGVLVNDFAKLTSTKPSDIKKYIRDSTKNENVAIALGGEFPVYRALKRIKKGKEFYAHYGWAYWLLSMGIPPNEISDLNKKMGGFSKLYK